VRLALCALSVALCQVSLSMSATAIVLAGARPGAAAVAEEECECEHSAAVMCPMHRRSAPKPAAPGTPRWCSAGDDSLLALVPVYGALAVPEALHRLLPPPATPRALARVADRPTDLDSPPDSPPPRA
jgi:hypothetical protein